MNPPTSLLRLVCRLGIPFLAAIASTSVASERPAKSMTPNIKHHIVRFPDCRLHFDYPADLEPSPDFVMDRMESEVDYRTIRWVTTMATDSFIEMHSDFRRGIFNKVQATLGISMWLNCTPPDFDGDVRNAEDLKRSYAAISAAAGGAARRESLEEIVIGGRVWAYCKAANLYTTGLNRRIVLLVRVGVSANGLKPGKARDWAENANEIILNSLRVELPGAASAGTP